MIEIVIDAADSATDRLWIAVGELAERLPAGWVLIGGLMVQLHAIEHGIVDVRPTRDIDVLGQARPPGALRALDAALRDGGFELHDPDADGYGYGWDGIVVDLLSPDGIKPPPMLAGGVTAVGVPGGTQALERAEDVVIRVGERSFQLRRPTLLGAVLIKSRSLMVHHDAASQREDLLRLLSLIREPRELAAGLRDSERRWLRKAEMRLELRAVSLLTEDVHRRAELAYRLLTRNSADSGRSAEAVKRRSSQAPGRQQSHDAERGRGPLER